MKFWIGAVIVLLILVSLFFGMMYYSKHTFETKKVGECVSLSTGRGGFIDGIVIDKTDSTITLKLPIEPGFAQLTETDIKNCEDIK